MSPQSLLDLSTAHHTSPITSHLLCNPPTQSPRLSLEDAPSTTAAADNPAPASPMRPASAADKSRQGRPCRASTAAAAKSPGRASAAAAAKSPRRASAAAIAQPEAPVRSTSKEDDDGDAVADAAANGAQEAAAAIQQDEVERRPLPAVAAARKLPGSRRVTQQDGDEGDDEGDDEGEDNDSDNDSTGDKTAGRRRKQCRGYKVRSDVSSSAFEWLHWEWVDETGGNGGAPGQPAQLAADVIESKAQQDAMRAVCRRDPAWAARWCATKEEARRLLKEHWETVRLQRWARHVAARGTGQGGGGGGGGQERVAGAAVAGGALELAAPAGGGMGLNVGAAEFRPRPKDGNPAPVQPPPPPQRVPHPQGWSPLQVQQGIGGWRQPQPQTVVGAGTTQEVVARTDAFVCYDSGLQQHCTTVVYGKSKPYVSTHYTAGNQQVSVRRFLPPEK